jgi:hypothetical protein
MKEGESDEMTEMLRKKDETRREIGDTMTLFRTLEKLTRYEFFEYEGKLPGEIKSNEEPPINIDDKSEIIPIDECLGLYEPSKFEITVFNKGIKGASRITNRKSSDLECIVRLHEWAHAIIHIGMKKEDRLRVFKEKDYWDKHLTQATAIFNSIETKLHELLAQLFTYYSLNVLYEDAKHRESKETINRRIETFKKFNKFQPFEYRIDNYFELPQERVIESLKLIKEGWLRGKFEAWDAIVKW